MSVAAIDLRHGQADHADKTMISSRAHEARVDLLDRVREFCLKHDLNVTGPNLSIICNALSGANSELAEAFAKREMAGEPIDQRWIDTVARLDPQINARMSELDQLSDQLEYALMRFAQTARRAHEETSDHRTAIHAQIDEISESEPQPGTKSPVSRVIDISRAMIDRIHEVETAMERSQEETDKLRANLAQARMEADVDHLTRLPNRRAFERRFASASQEARSNNKPLCVAFCDVDHFKSINDRFGHDAGDRVLCAIATTLIDNAGDECFVARHGGEEFVLMFYGADKEMARNKLDGIRRAQAAKQLINRQTGKPFGKVTFSGGIAEVTEDGDNRSALSRADEALYRAKEQGRNTVIAI